MSKEIKVTDKRIFTPEGDLKDEFKHLEEERAREESRPEERTPAPDAGAPTAGSPIAPPDAPTPPPQAPASSGPAEAEPGRGSSGAAAAAFEGMEEPGELGSPEFLDLVSMLAQPAALYLGDARLPDGRSAEDLDMARLHIDLLDVLREKTAGNLDVEESSALEDVLYQLRMRYVRKRG